MGNKLRLRPDRQGRVVLGWLALDSSFFLGGGKVKPRLQDNWGNPDFMTHRRGTVKLGGVEVRAGDWAELRTKEEREENSPELGSSREHSPGR